MDAALQDLEAFHIFGAVKQMELFVFHFQEDVAPCAHMSDDIAAIESWAQIFTNKTELISTATKHFLLHKKAITGDIATVKADWANKQYFATGKTAADLITTLVGPIE